MDLRRGMWVASPEGIGVLVNMDGMSAEVHLVNDEGETIAVRRGVALADVAQATLNEIPTSRQPDAETATRMGYA